jgi:hypothetical protein
MRERAVQERNGVRIGMRVRDLDGKDLGRVTDLYASAFGVEKGLPFLFRSEATIAYDELRGARDGALVVARSARLLPELAAGELPDAWRVPVPAGFPSAATPAEARAIIEDLASARRGETLVPSAPVAKPSLAPGDVREFVESSGESIPASTRAEPPPAHP